LKVKENIFLDSQEALDLYRIKDVAEKSFYQYKNNLGLNRLHVHSDQRALNKVFVAFIALTISCHVHKVMRDSGLNRVFSFGKLLVTLSKLKIAYVNSNPVLQPLTKEQKLIFKSFAINLPGGAAD
jgi:transposase